MFTQSILDGIRKIAFEKKAGYPYLAALLKQAGVEKYHVNMNEYTTTFFLYDGTKFTEQGNDNAIIGDIFDELALVDALRKHQRGETDFSTRLNATRAAGCIDYIADLAAMIVTYRGNGGEYIEVIPTVSV